MRLFDFILKIMEIRFYICLHKNLIYKPMQFSEIRRNPDDRKEPPEK